jgi:hypothetical protein
MMIGGSDLGWFAEDCAMSQTDTRSLQQIKRDTEQTRAGLTDTVEQLKTSVADTASDIRRRVSPDAIKAEVSDYIRSRGEQLLNDVSAAARRNPMQAVAVGASVAYPLLRLARAIPVPVLMVGAGLFFAGSKTGQAATQKASDIASDLSDEVVRRAREFGDQVGETASAAKAYASDQFDRISAGVSAGTDQASRTADAASTTVTDHSKTLQDTAASFGSALSDGASDLREQAVGLAGSAAATVQDKSVSLGNSMADRTADLKDQGIRMAGSAATTVQDMAANATAFVRDAAGTTAVAGLNAGKALRDTAFDITDRTGKTIFQTIEQNPLLVAGVGLLIGGLIASALPRSDIEDGLVGDASTAVKRRAQAAASQGFDAAKNAVGEVYDEASRQAEQEGLTPNGITNAAQDLGQRVRRVAESAVTTAFEPPQENHHQTGTHGETDHG